MEVLVECDRRVGQQVRPDLGSVRFQEIEPLEPTRKDVPVSATAENAALRDTEAFLPVVAEVCLQVTLIAGS
jgi:hypothetical protein